LSCVSIGKSNCGIASANHTSIIPGHDFTDMTDMNEFVIDFSYRGAAYTGLVTPKPEGGQGGYAVRLESENQEFNLDIFANPCGEGKWEWCFKEVNPESENDKDLLMEIGEAIEKYQAGSG
jgi:hypothetical protein